LARLANRQVADLLADTIVISLPVLTDRDDMVRPVNELANVDILALTNLQLPPEQDERLSQLLAKQQMENLYPSERAELQALMQIYQIGLLRKSQALTEAVKRGILPALEP
jgi:hypothetical protein